MDEEEDVNMEDNHEKDQNQPAKNKAKVTENKFHHDNEPPMMEFSFPMKLRFKIASKSTDEANTKHQEILCTIAVHTK